VTPWRLVEHGVEIRLLRRIRTKTRDLEDSCCMQPSVGHSDLENKDIVIFLNV
jgi:hypothetical protein